jgi:hypothetical protein
MRKVPRGFDFSPIQIPVCKPSVFSLKNPHAACNSGCLCSELCLLAFFAADVAGPYAALLRWPGILFIPKSDALGEISLLARKQPKLSRFLKAHEP